MDRRLFIKRSCLTCLGTAWLPFALSGCSPTRYIDGIISGNQLRIKPGDFTEIRNGKTILHKFVIVRHDQLKFPVSVYRLDESRFTALYMQCSHQGCEVNAYETQLVCPCHGSEYSPEGKVLQGPAESDLTRFQVTAGADYITVHLK